MKVFNAFFSLYRTVLYLVVALFLLVAVGPMAVGIRPYVVMSASMEPVIMTGSLAYIQKNDSKSPFADMLDYKEPAKGDVVAFKQGSGDTAITVVHRIHDINEKGDFIMKGDNNSNTDIAAVSKENIIGNFKFSIPYLGKVVTLLQTKQGLIAAVALMVIAFVSSFLSDNSDRNEEEEKENNVENEVVEPVPTPKPKKKGFALLSAMPKFGKKGKTATVEDETPMPKAQEFIPTTNDTDDIEIKFIEVQPPKPRESSSLWGAYFKDVPYDELEKMHTKVLAPPLWG